MVVVRLASVGGPAEVLEPPRGPDDDRGGPEVPSPPLELRDLRPLGHAPVAQGDAQARGSPRVREDPGDLDGELARREAAAGSGVRAYSLHPGTVRTDIFRHLAPASALWALETLFAPLLWLVTKSPLEGAQTQLFLATAPHSDLGNGAYYEDCAVSARVNPLAADAGLAQALWRKSDALVGLGAEPA